MTSLATGLGILSDTGTRVDGHRLADDETILDQLADMLTRVGVCDLIGLVRVEPDFVLAALQHGGCKTLLQTE